MSEQKKNAVEMIVDLAKAFDGYMKNEMKTNGMKASYRHLLRPLAVKDGVTQLDLVKISHLKAPTVSTTLRNMEAEGLVTRETDKDDARATRVFITEKGRKIDEKMRESASKAVSLMLGDISETESDKAVKFMLKVAENVKSNGEAFSNYED